MAEREDKTKQLLEQILSELYTEQGTGVSASGESYLIAQDGQFLGKITKNRLDNQSILNRYGPFGSKYSTTSIFNNYSQYGSKYGAYSINNPYCSQPPKLFLKGKFVGVVSTNKFVSQRIPADIFLKALEKNIDSLISGKVPKDEIEIRQEQGESFIIANDKTYLGSLIPNEYDTNSIFNQYGPYGSEYSQTSIFNQYCPYGGEFSQLSPFNSFSQTPPKIFINGRLVGHLTVNQFVQGNKIDPRTIKEWARQNLVW